LFNEEILRETAVLAFMDLAERTAMRAKIFHSRDKDDIVSAGYEALVKAVAAYNPGRGYFGSFAARCVKNAVADEIQSMKVNTVSIEEVEPVLFTVEEHNAALEGLKGKERILAEMLLAGYRKSECAKKLKVSNARVNQLCKRIAMKISKGELDG